MSKRKMPSRRRWKARLSIGRPVPMEAIVQHDMQASLPSCSVDLNRMVVTAREAVRYRKVGRRVDALVAVHA